jgi:hypothetical protein
VEEQRTDQALEQLAERELAKDFDLAVETSTLDLSLRVKIFAAKIL